MTDMTHLEKERKVIESYSQILRRSGYTQEESRFAAIGYKGDGERKKLGYITATNMDGYQIANIVDDVWVPPLRKIWTAGALGLHGSITTNDQPYKAHTDNASGFAIIKATQNSDRSPAFIANPETKMMRFKKTFNNAAQLENLVNLIYAHGEMFGAKYRRDSLPSDYEALSEPFKQIAAATEKKFEDLMKRFQNETPTVSMQGVYPISLQQ